MTSGSPRGEGATFTTQLLCRESGCDIWLPSPNGTHAKSGFLHAKTGTGKCQVGAVSAGFVRGRCVLRRTGRYCAGVCRGGPLCVVLGATVRVLIGGGPLCVVLGATMRVLLGGGAFCVVLGSAWRWLEGDQWPPWHRRPEAPPHEGDRAHAQGLALLWFVCKPVMSHRLIELFS